MGVRHERKRQQNECKVAVVVLLTWFVELPLLLIVEAEKAASKDNLSSVLNFIHLNDCSWQ